MSIEIFINIAWVHVSIRKKINTVVKFQANKSFYLIFRDKKISDQFSVQLSINR